MAASVQAQFIVSKDASKKKKKRKSIEVRVGELDNMGWTEYYDMK